MNSQTMTAAELRVLRADAAKVRAQQTEKLAVQVRVQPASEKRAAA